MTGMLAIIAVYQVVARYFLHWNITWTEETMRYLFVAICMLGIHFVSKMGSFATLTFFSDKIAKHFRTGSAILRILQYTAQIVFYFLLFYYGVNLVRNAGAQVSSAVRYPFVIVYLPLPIGGFLGCMDIVVKCFQDFWPRTNKPVGEGENAG
jgi:TRAP-type C4-dicarboxylate transport system permease small subunit